MSESDQNQTLKNYYKTEKKIRILKKKNEIFYIYCRDFRLLSIGGGADEVMLSIICKYMDILPVPPKKKK